MLVAALLGYYVLAMLSIGVSRLPGSIAAIWLPDAAAMCLLLTRPRRDWPWLLLAFAAGNTGANLTYGDTAAKALSFVPGNLTAALLGAMLVDRLLPRDMRAGLHPATLGAMLAAGAGVASAVAALAGAPLVGAVLDIPAGDLWLTWFISAALGGVTVLPIGLALLRGRFDLRGTTASHWIALALVAPMVTGLTAQTAYPYVFVCTLLVLYATVLPYSSALVGITLASLAMTLTEALGVRQASLLAAGSHLSHLAALLPALLVAAHRARGDEVQARFDALYRHAPEGILLSSPSGAVLAANPSAQVLFGATEVEMGQMHRDGLFDSTDARAGVIAEAARRGHDAFGTVRLRRTDGSTFEADVSTASYRLPSGEVASHVFVRDVGDRDAQKRQIESAKDLLQNLTDQVPGMLYTFELATDGRMRFPFVSRASVTTFGMTAEALRADAREAFGRVHPEDMPALAEAITASARDLTPFHAEFRFAGPDGRTLWVTADSAPARQPDGSTLWYGVMNDTTARRIEEDIRRDEQARTELALTSGGIGTWDADLRTGVHLVNDRWCEMLGYEPHEIAPRLEAFHAMVHPDDLPTVRDHEVWRGMEVGTKMQVLALRMRHKDGSWRWIESRAMLVERSADGQALRLCGTTLDVTERVESDRLRAERDRADAANLAKTTFMSRMSHELRTPLNAVLGFAQLLATEDDTRLNATQRDQVGQILQASEHLLSLINDLLDLTRIEAGEMAFHLESVGLEAALRAAAVATDGLFRQHGVVLQGTAVDAALCVRADRLRMQQVLINLLSNAAKYNRPGGWVRIECAVMPGPDGGRDQVALTVADSGRGLSEDQMAHLFEPFNRLGAETGDVEGTGIGLTITRRLVQGMGGRLEVQSQAGQGSRFTLTLERCQGSQPTLAPAEAPAPAPAPVRRLRVVYAEDNPVNVLLVQQMSLRQPLVDLEVAENGAIAMAAARRQRPDLMLIDMNLGDMSGLQLCAALKAEPELAGVPCVALSADAMPAQVEAAREAGFADYLTKPLKMAVLLGLYTRALEGGLDGAGRTQGETSQA